MTLPVSDLNLVALSPSDVGPAQAQLVDWCYRKMRALGHEYVEMLQNVTVAKKQNWKRTHLQRAAGLLKRRIQYYQKMRSAVRAGYLIIPNLPAEIMAVRVNKYGPGYSTATYPSHINEAKAERLPVGVGRYVDETNPHNDISYHDEKGNIVRRVSVNSYDDEVDFPVLAVKPIVLEATARAMALKIFDRIGVARGSTVSARSRRADPLVVGQLLDPRGGGRMVTFFVAWWLDTSVL